MNATSSRRWLPILSAFSAAAVCNSSKKPGVRLQSPGTDESPLSTLSPIAPFRILRPNPNLEICYDTRTRNAVYVQHRLVPDESKKNNPRRPRFFEEKSIEAAYRSKDSTFTSSGYDRGHLAPAADFRSNDQEFQDTFNLCNASPQDKDLNRKLWSRLEEWTRRVAQRAAQTGAVTYVTTGPVWLPRAQLQEKVFVYNVKGIGTPPSLVMVPSHFFKLVVVVDADHTRILDYACFVVPNEASANEKKLEDYVVAWSDLEMVTGLVLFPGLADAPFRTQADALAHSVHPHKNQVMLLSDGKQRYKRPGRSAQSLHHLCENGACSFPKKSGS